MTDRLALRLTLTTHIGVTAGERREPQEILVSLSMENDSRTVAKADDPVAGVDYALLTEEIRKLAKIERKTIERLAEDIATSLLQASTTSWVSVTVTKKPPLEGVEEASVTIERRREIKPVRRGPLLA
ncbi:MAG: dihydroneopterin aldolase [Candidatus Peribacteraceae bacterium]|jgi:FolB domain-containing protein